MIEVGAFEAKNTLGSLLDRVEQGEEVVITRHGKAVARMVPHEGRLRRDKARVAADRIRARASQLKIGRFNWKSLKRERDAGRP